MHKMTTDRAIYTQCHQQMVRKMPSWYGSNGCFLSKSEIGSDGYFEQKPGKESDIGMLKLTIIPNTRNREHTEISLDKVYY